MSTVERSISVETVEERLFVFMDGKSSRVKNLVAEVIASASTVNKSPCARMGAGAVASVSTTGAEQLARIAEALAFVSMVITSTIANTVTILPAKSNLACSKTTNLQVRTVFRDTCEAFTLTTQKL